MNDLVEILYAQLAQPMKVQCARTNVAFRAMSTLEAQQADLNERLEIARLEWKREDRKWKEMLAEDAASTRERGGE